MPTLIIFILSGVALMSLTLAKRVEMKSKRPSFLLKLVSKGDEHARVAYHEALHFYSEGKHRAAFFVKKQLPLKAKSYVNKGVSYVKAKGEERFGNMRNSRLIKRDGGISEFFKTISEMEKGAGEINESLHATPVVEVAAPEVMGAKEGAVVETITPLESPKAKKSRAPRKKKVEVVFTEDVTEVVPEVTIVPEPEATPVLPVIEAVPTQPHNFKPIQPRKRRLKVVELGE